jgi:proteasome lid subunit RPN8/RPN11
MGARIRAGLAARLCVLNVGFPARVVSAFVAVIAFPKAASAKSARRKKMKHLLRTTKSQRLKLRRLLRRPRETRLRSPRRPRLRFSPTAWAKLLFLRDHGPTEVGGFGITPANHRHLLFVEDVRLVRQSCTALSVAFDDVAVAEFFDEQVDAGRRPEHFARIWLHTHPGESAQPSQVDELTFRRAFGACDWAVMFILARGGETYCRLRFRVGPGASFEIPVEIDFEREFVGSDSVAWSREYAATVTSVPFQAPSSSLDDLSVAEFACDDLWDSFDPGKEQFIR